MRPLFADTATTRAYQSLVLKMKEIERQNKLVCLHVTELIWRFFGTYKGYASVHLAGEPGGSDPFPFSIQSKLCPQILKPI